MAPTGFRGIWREDALARAVYSESAGIGRAVPAAVAVPLDADDVRALVAWAAEQGRALIPRGAGSSMAGAATGEGIVLDLSALRELWKAVIIQGLGVVATGGVTVEQAYIGFSTIFHTTFVKYLLDVLKDGFKLPNEKAVFEGFRHAWNTSPGLSALTFTEGPLHGRDAIISELCRVGRYTVEKGFVDSFFGNISYFDGTTIYISQTTSSLDELEGFIDPVPVDGSSTAGLSASSELPTHRGIYLGSHYRAVLHGHPRFSIVLSMCINLGKYMRTHFF